MEYTTINELVETAKENGMVIAKRASVSGAQGGCQAECGSAAANDSGSVDGNYGRDASAGCGCLCHCLEKSVWTVLLLGNILAAASFCIFYGGNLWDCLIAGIVGASIWLLENYMAPICLN